MVKEFPTIPWARYADDGIAHSVSLKQAKYLQRRLQKRFECVGLELNLEKTRIVYCKDDDHKGNHEHTSGDMANMFNRQIQGWINHYTHFYRSEIYDVLRYSNQGELYDGFCNDQGTGED